LSLPRPVLDLDLTEAAEAGRMRRLIYVLSRRRRGHPIPTWHSRSPHRPVDLRVDEPDALRPDAAVDWPDANPAPSAPLRELWER
jgi:hypothetical protein